MWKGKGFPEDWTRGIIVSLHKKRAGNYRRTTLLSTAYKLYAGILDKRLKTDIEEKKILGDTQADSRKGRCTIDNAYII